jgi:hypothetical protein
MKINVKKTKVVIFQKRNSKIPNLKFHIGNQEIDITKEYTYLGLKLNQNGKFKIAQQQLSEKAIHAFYKIRKNIDFHKLSSKIGLKIFDAIRTPILLYNSEVWGAYEKNDMNKWDNSQIENVQLRFCKLYLGTNRKASNIACRAELGKFQLLISIKRNIINYTKHIHNLPDQSLVKQSLKLPKELYENNKESYYGNIINMLKTFYPDQTNIETDIINYQTKTIVENMKEKYVEFWKHKMLNSSKLSFLGKFKKDYRIEPYLSVVKNPTVRKTFSKFRISNHKLEIEYGRYKNIPREKRTCKLCHSDEVEDEFHFAFTCQKYNDIRANSNNILKNLFDLGSTTESKAKILIQIMLSDDPVVIHLFSEFIYTCHKNRENSLKSMVL